jgi:hypothetical protein
LIGSLRKPARRFRGPRQKASVRRNAGVSGAAVFAAPFLVRARIVCFATPYALFATIRIIHVAKRVAPAIGPQALIIRLSLQCRRMELSSARRSFAAARMVNFGWGDDRYRKSDLNCARVDSTRLHCKVSHRCAAGKKPVFETRSPHPRRSHLKIGDQPL